MTLSAAATSEVTVQYRLLSGTAQEGDDAYFRPARSVTFAAGETSKTISAGLRRLRGGALTSGGAGSVQRQRAGRRWRVMRRRCGRPAGSSTTMAAATSWRCSPRGRVVVEGDSGSSRPTRSEPVAASARSLLGELHDGRWQRSRAKTTPRISGTPSFVEGQTSAR